MLKKLVILSLAGGTMGAAGAQADTPGAVPPAPVPLAFIANEGQWDAPAKFVARRGPMGVLLEPDAIVLQLQTERSDVASRGVVTELTFEGALDNARLEGEGKQPGSYSFHLGRDRASWRARVAAYDSVIYHGLYEGVDLRVRDAAGRLEYDLLLAPGADLGQVVVRCDGVDGIEVDGEGRLVMHTARGPVYQTPPATWIELPTGEREPVDCRFCRIDDKRYGFDGPDGRQDLPLVVDPGLEWSTYLGTAQGEFVVWPNGLTHDGNGYVVITGTSAGAFPTTAGAYDTTPGFGEEVFVSVLDPSLSGAAQLVYSTFIGGNGSDRPRAVKVDSQGRIVVTGRTNSTDFPTTAGAYDTTHAGDMDGFVCILDATLSTLVYSTYLGGTEVDAVTDVSEDSQGNLVITGSTGSATTFPTTAGAYETVFQGGDRDGFVAILDPSRAVPADQLVASTFLGGIDAEFPHHVEVDEFGMVVVMADTQSFDFPTTLGAYDTTFNGGGRDATVSRLSADLSSLVYSTFFGGTGDENGNALAVSAGGTVTFAGWTTSDDLPVSAGAFDQTINGLYDAYVAQLNVTLDTVVACTYVGGSFDDGGNGVAIDGAGHVTVVGVTHSPDYPVTSAAVQPVYNGGETDAHITRLSATLGAIDYCTFLGGSGEFDYGYVVYDDDSLSVTVAGLTTSPDFETTADSFDPSYNGFNDAYVARVDVCPWDCANDDGEIDIVEFLAVLGQWGTTGSCDFDGGGVGITEFLEILGRWGPCP